MLSPLTSNFTEPETVEIKPRPATRKSIVKLSKPLPAHHKQQLNKTPDSSGITAAFLAALILSIFDLIDPLVPEANSANRFAGAVGGGFSVLTLSSIAWLLTVVFHRMPFGDWHRSSGWPIFWITAISLAVLITT